MGVEGGTLPRRRIRRVIYTSPLCSPRTSLCYLRGVQSGNGHGPPWTPSLDPTEIGPVRAGYWGRMRLVVLLRLLHRAIAMQSGMAWIYPDAGLRIQPVETVYFPSMHVVLEKQCGISPRPGSARVSLLSSVCRYRSGVYNEQKNMHYMESKVL